MGLFKPNRSALVSFMVRIFLLAFTIQDGHVTDCFLRKLSSFLMWVRITGLTEPLNLSVNNEIKQLFSKKINFAQIYPRLAC